MKKKYIKLVTLFVENWSAVIIVKLNLVQKGKEIAFVMKIIFVKCFEKYINICYSVLKIFLGGIVGT